MLALSSLSACKTPQLPVEVDDFTLYYLKQASDDDWGLVLHFLSQGNSHLSKAQWESLSEGKVCLSLQDWSNIDNMVSEFCSSPSIDCNYKIANGQTLAQALNGFFYRIRMAATASHRALE